MSSAGPPDDGAPLREAVIAGLERTIWTPPAGVCDVDRVEAVQLLGQFRAPAASRALVRVLTDGPQRIQPAPVGRWLRDTALDTLLRSTAQPAAATDRALARYYRFGNRLLSGRLDRNLIYDDIPLLVQHGRGGLVLRAYVLPLAGLLLALAVLAELVFGKLRPPAGNDLLALCGGPILFGGAGLGLFNLHQVLLVLLVANLGRRLPLLALSSARAKGIAGATLVLVATLLSLYDVANMLSFASEFRAADLGIALRWLLPLPLLVLPCYMLAHDLELSAETGTAGAGHGLNGLAFWLRWTSGMIYIAYVLVAFGLYFFAKYSPGSAGLATGNGDVDVFAGILPLLLYLTLAPLPVLLVLAALGRLQQLLRPAPAAG